MRTLSSGKFVEGVVEELDFKLCLVGLRVPSGLVYVGLTDVAFVQLVCKEVRPAKEMKPPKLNAEEDACANMSLKWIKVHIGDAVRVEIASVAGSFEAEVVEINWKYGFVGLKTVSGVTYVPIDTFTAVEKLCAKPVEKK